MWLWLMVEVVVVVVVVGGVNVFGQWDILFYCKRYIILLF